MAGLDWLIARPVAHRGLHDAQKGVIENTPSAFAAAIAGAYGIECDLQISADGEAMVYHDDTLDRLTDGKGRLDALTAAELKRLPFKATADRMITLAELCELVAGRATLVVELKSRLTGDRRLVERAAKALGRYRGPVALMSFDPAQIATLRVIAPQVPRGLVAESPHLSPPARAPPRRGEGRARLARAVPARAPAVHRIFRRRPARDPADGRAQDSGPPASHLDRAQRRATPHGRALCRPDDL